MPRKLIAMLLILTGGCGSEREATLSPEAQETKRRLSEIIVPSVTFEDATVEEAIEFLRQKSVEHQPENWERRVSGVHPTSNTDPLEGAETGLVTMRRKDISVWDALQETAAQAGVEIVVHDSGHIGIAPKRNK